MSVNTYDADVAIPERQGPQAILGVMGSVVEAALAANVLVVHASEVVPGVGGRAQLEIATERPPWSPATAPEHAKTGPTQATLAYAVGAIGAHTALGSLEAAPEVADAHRVWVESVVDRLETRWAGRRRAEEVIEWIARCLAFEPADRPEPRQLVAQIQRAAVPRRSNPPATATAPASVASVSAEGAPPAPATRARKPIPRWATPALVVASVTLAIGLCTLGALVGQAFDELPQATAEPASAPVPVPAAAPPAPVAPVVHAASIEAPAPATIGFSEPEPIDAKPAPDRAERRDRAPVPDRSRDDHARADAAPARPPPPVEPSDTAPRPQAAPGSDLRDPWTRPAGETEARR